MPNCKACRYQFFRGTITKAICTQCDTGYVVKAAGRVPNVEDVKTFILAAKEPA